MKVRITSSFKRLLDKIKDKNQLLLIKKDIQKLMEEGEKSIKILFQKGRYALGEIKHRRPPYRLYVVIDYQENIIYVVDWKHKKEQEKIIEKLKEYLKLLYQ